MTTPDAATDGSQCYVCLACTFMPSLTALLFPPTGSHIASPAVGLTRQCACSCLRHLAHSPCSVLTPDILCSHATGRQLRGAHCDIVRQSACNNLAVRAQGSVSIMAHSLGSVLTYDVLCNQPLLDTLPAAAPSFSPAQQADASTGGDKPPAQPPAAEGGGSRSGGGESRRQPSLLPLSSADLGLPVCREDPVSRLCFLSHPRSSRQRAGNCLCSRMRVEG